MYREYSTPPFGGQGGGCGDSHKKAQDQLALRFVCYN